MKINTRLFFLLLFLAIGLNLAGINTPFFTDDPGLYASVAKQMLYHHDYLNLYTYGRDWLDKPHFPFWVAALSFQIFGISVWSYKLPALFFFFGGIYYTWLFTRKYYGADTARLAVLIALLGQHVIMSNIDVRAEPYLFCLLVASIYHISNLKDRFSYTDLFAAALFTACAIMTKGIFIIIGIYGALLGEVLFKGEFLWEIKKLKYWLLLALTAVFLLPEIWALYTQFDLHPEKRVFGKTGFSGLKFFFWDSQFGRFFNSGPITRKSGDVFFFVHTLLWAFAPWCLLLYYSYVRKIGGIIKRQKLNEYYTLSGSLALLLIFSVSGFQLPFYTNILFPLFAVLCAPVLTTDLPKTIRNYIYVSQGIYIAALALAIIFLCFNVSTNTTFHSVIIAIVVLLLFTYYNSIAKQRVSKLLVTFVWSCAFIILANFFVILYLYPVLVAHKGEIPAAQLVNKTLAKTDSVFVFEDTHNIFQFYVNRPVKIIPLQQFGQNTSTNNLYYLGQENIDKLNASHVSYKLRGTFMNYDNENITPAFLHPSTRESTLVKVYVISH